MSTAPKHYSQPDPNAKMSKNKKKKLKKKQKAKQALLETQMKELEEMEEKEARQALEACDIATANTSGASVIGGPFWLLLECEVISALVHYYGPNNASWKINMNTEHKNCLVHNYEMVNQFSY